jgi:L-malate glycosyltransferase
LKSKILFILHLPPPIHGAAMVGQSIRQSRIINDTFECHFIKLSTSKKINESGKGSFRKLPQILKLYIKIFSALIKNRYDLCYFNITSKGLGFYKDFVIVILLKIFGCKIVYHYHNKGISERQNNWFLNFMKRIQFKNANVILISSLLYYDVAKFFHEEKIHYCANGIPEISGINLDVINSNRAAKEIPDILYFSNMMVEKGVFTLLEACKMLYSRGISFNMIFIGDWVDIKESEFNDYIKLNNLQDNIFYGGKKYGEEKYAYFENSDIFVLPTHNDVFPLSILEAMQFGLPIISSKEGGIPDMVFENENGYLVNKKNVIELADKIQYLIQNPDARIRMGVASRKKFQEQFKINVFENNLIRYLKAIIKDDNLKIHFMPSSTSPPKVLFIYKFLPQYRVDFFQQLKDALLKQNIELQLIYGKSKGNDALKNDEVDINWGKYIPNKRFGIGKFILIWQPCLKHIKGNDLVIVQLENKLLINYYLMFARHFSSYKLGYWGHGRNMQANISNLRNKFKYLYLYRCNWWFAYTESVRKEVVKHYFPENKITVVQNAIDTLKLKKWYAEINQADLDNLKYQLGITSSKTGIYCGGMYLEKRIDFILEVCYKVKKEIPDFHMIFVGAGIESDKAIEASKTDEWIHYIGPKFGKDRIQYFKISSIQLMPGLVGLGILDSFALETPIITTNYPYHSPEIDYLQNGVNGLMTNNNNDDYSKAIIDILKTEKYLDLIEGCKMSSDKYTVENMVENFKNGILSCLADKKS